MQLALGCADRYGRAYAHTGRSRARIVSAFEATNSTTAAAPVS